MRRNLGLHCHPSLSGQLGFTLIELIMVIVILGILSAFALPRFADLTDDAEAASISGARSSVRSAAAIVHASWLASGSAGATVDLEGATINIVNGYPDAETIDEAADVGANDFTFAVNAAGNVTIFTTATPAVGDPCFTYTEAPASGAPVVSAVAALVAGTTPALTDGDETCA